ncbi:myo-inosose-2 dehydratase [Brevibacillus centrosporus]|uniref:myo-inosose-2 dehydratase n=1 Tax=Brevibacillus centrosporus TaxID=54910 RepID=UPI000F0A126B|nr:myo-inosose-2 dehydratase [Brevibacillus centrosporus]MEC2129626.1 myo-inosose-2 dehydratase [Brevibacillus centrosporus]RNB65772.1 myo-inosose-2 dehydratase [Brevibacillus centrosporus]GED29984.1 inosose dehydratase [Brevibacillus centrosporus]
MSHEYPFQLGISAINWVNEDVWTVGDHYTGEQVLADMQRLGFHGTENCRKFPKDTKALQEVLRAYDMRLTSQWKSILFTDPRVREQEMQAFRAHVDFLEEMGCKHVVVCEITNSFQDYRKATSVQVEPLTEEEWGHLVEGLNQAGAYSHSKGLQLVYHYHAGTVVEGPREIEKLLKLTDPLLVGLLYDTGHAYYGGEDPLELLQTHFDRIAYMHIKSVRQEVLDWKRENNISFTEAVVKGLFTVPGDGCIDFAPIFREIRDRHYQGWIILEAEQDPTLADPVIYAERAKTYIASTWGNL